MAAFLRAQVTIPIDGGVPADSVTNTWHFRSEGPRESEDTYLAPRDALFAFYQAIDGPILASSVGTIALIKVFDLEDAEPRVPRVEDEVSITPGVGSALPHEVAICLSFQAAPASGIAQARRRGRIYLGPVAGDTLEVVNGESHVSAAARTAIADAAEALLVFPTTPDQHWAVYSPTTDLTATLASSFFDVEDGWVDNSYDIQRRRGRAATTRTIWP